MTDTTTAAATATTTSAAATTDTKTGTVLDDAAAKPWTESVDARFKNDKGEVNAEAIWKGYGELNSRLGKTGLPPESADKYEFKAPDGVTIDEEAAKTFRAAAHAEGLSNKQFGFVMNSMLEAVDGTAAETLAQALGTPEGCREVLRKDFGADYDRQLGLAQKFAGAYGVSKETLKLIGNIPDVVKMMAKAGAELGEDRGVNSGSGQGAVDADALMNEPAYLNPLHKDHKATKEKVYRARGLGHLLEQ